MKPIVQRGDIILSTWPMDLSAGQIVVYCNLNGKLIIHRIMETYKDGDVFYYLTKGDAEKEADPPISQEQIIGVLRYKLPFVGFLVLLLKD